MSELKCPFCGQELKPQTMGGEWLECWNCSYHEPSHHPFPQRELCGIKKQLETTDLELDQLNLEKYDIEDELDRTRKALDKGMEHITGLNNMIESWYKLLQSDKDASTKYAILKSAISAYVENKGGDNE